MRRTFLWGGVLFGCVGATGAEWNLDLGALMTNVARRTQTSSPLQSQVSRITGYFRFRTHLHFGSGIGMEPALGLTLPWRSGADGSVKTFTTRLELPFSFGRKTFRFRLGPGVELNIISPTAGEVELNNGVGTSTFYMPGMPRGSWLFSVHGGGVVRLADWLAMTVDVYVTGIADRLRRRVHSAVGFAWVL